MQTIQRGSRVPQVKLVQRLVNLRKPPRPRLVEDSIFGPRTDAAVRRYKTSSHLSGNGVVDMTTWRSLGVTIDISNPVRLFGQPTNMTCWSAAATMLLGTNMSIGPGSASTGATGGLRPQFANLRTFANGLGLHMYPQQSWSVQGIAGLLRRGPAWVAGWVPTGHAVVYGGIHGDGTPDGTLIVIYDPWPVGRGQVRGELYGDWLRLHPIAATYILQKL